MTFFQTMWGSRLAAAMLCLSLAETAALAQRAGGPQKDYPIQPVPFTNVQVNDNFWAPRIETNRVVSVPFAFQQCEMSGRVANFERAALALRGQLGDADRKVPGTPFDDTDIYKVIEGASYAMSVHPDPKLDTYVDSLIAKIAAAQEKDGYLYTTRTINPAHPHEWSGTERWQTEEVLSHELYDLGHLYEAAVAHYQATKKRTLLDIALKSADLLCQTFGPGKRAIWPGHQIVEMGLVKLYRVSGNERYLNLAKFMLDVRGPKASPYNQAHMPVVQQTEAVGHAVRATYMYSGMADVAAMTGDAAYVHAIDAIWENVVGKKLYITGGIGSTEHGEAFGADYELPNMTAYNETCAAIGNDYWNHRLFLLHGDSKYIDVMERTLYNGLLSGVALDGKSFFYPNPLESNGQHVRLPWFGVACCPGNMTRFMASLPGYVYAADRGSVYVNLFVAGAANIQMPGGRKLKLAQETRYPWEGAVRITVTPEQAGRFAIKVRIPGWARGEAMPGGLYHFAETSDAPVVLKVNQKAVPIQLDKGYVALDREWKAGDTIELNLPMTIHRVVASDRVEADRNRTAIQRGPLVFTAEWPDNPGQHVRNLVLPPDQKLTAEFRPALLNGVVVVKGKAIALSYGADGSVARKEQEFTAIPYYAWANRGSGQMAVWLPDRESAAKPRPWPTLAMQSAVTASGEKTMSNGVKDPHRINDGEEPASARDSSSSYDWTPVKGAPEWVEYAFPKAARVSAVQVYWQHDAEGGEIRVPASWRLLYRDGEQWKPVSNLGEYGVEPGRYNRVAFQSVTTTNLRIELTLQPKWSAGIQEWKVE